MVEHAKLIRYIQSAIDSGAVFPMSVDAVHFGRHCSIITPEPWCSLDPCVPASKPWAGVHAVLEGLPLLPYIVPHSAQMRGPSSSIGRLGARQRGPWLVDICHARLRYYGGLTHDQLVQLQVPDEILSELPVPVLDFSDSGRSIAYEAWSLPDPAVADPVSSPPFGPEGSSFVDHALVATFVLEEFVPAEAGRANVPDLTCLVMQRLLVPPHERSPPCG